MIELIGWVSGVMLAICGLPQAIKSYKDKHSDGISWLFLLLWGFGEILTLIYFLLKNVLLIPVLFNYSLNIVFIGIIFYYKLRRRV